MENKYQHIIDIISPKQCTTVSKPKSDWRVKVYPPPFIWVTKETLKNPLKVKKFNLKNNGYGLTDGTRTFRLQYKPKSKVWKANFQENIISPSGKAKEIKNIHMRITDM